MVENRGLSGGFLAVYEKICIFSELVVDFMSLFEVKWGRFWETLTRMRGFGDTNSPAFSIGGMIMKKMLAVCAACMVAGLASADVTSDNIVGFISTPAVDGFNWVAPMLTTVGADTVALKDISISDGGAGTIGYGGEIIMVLDAVGDVTASYSYAEGADGYVWNDDLTGDVATDSFVSGNAFAVFLADGLTLSVCGEVSNPQDVTLTTTEGFNFTGNPFPVDISIQDIAISDGDAGTIGYGGEIIMVLDAVGDVTASYSYAEGADGYVWNDDMTGDEADVALTPGSAFALYAADGLEVTIKAPDALKQLF
ncbi:MAG: hypothetical protein J6336_09455 [Kiritimatiellae bacterium]|nr:hypothetical protein [Kiritimatiellia bacterium]